MVVSTGRTVPTYRNELEIIIRSWCDYRRALRSEDRVVLDRLADMARLHASAASYQTSLDPFEPAFLSMMLELVKKIDSLEHELRRLKDGKGLGV